MPCHDSHTKGPGVDDYLADEGERAFAGDAERAQQEADHLRDVEQDREMVTEDIERPPEVCRCNTQSHNPDCHIDHTLSVLEADIAFPQRDQGSNPNPMRSRCGLEDCDCGHTIEKLETERRQMRWLVAAVVRGAVGAGPRGSKWVDGSCPHGTTPYYPSHAWWCDDCWTALWDAIFYGKILVTRGKLMLSL